MFALPISLPCFKVLFFYQNSPKIKLFLQKNAKFLNAWAPPQCFRQLGASPPDPHYSLSAGGFRPQNLPTAPSLRISGYVPDSSRLDMTIEPMA